MTKPTANPSDLQWNWAIEDGKLEFAIGDVNNPLIEFELNATTVLAELKDDIEEFNQTNDDEILLDWQDFLRGLKDLVESIENTLP